MDTLPQSPNKNTDVTAFLYRQAPTGSTRLRVCGCVHMRLIMCCNNVINSCVARDNLKTRCGWCWSRTTFPLSALLPGHFGPGDVGKRLTLSVVNAMFAWAEDESPLPCGLHSQKHVTRKDSRFKRLNLVDANVIPQSTFTPLDRLYTSDSWRSLSAAEIERNVGSNGAGPTLKCICQVNKRLWSGAPGNELCCLSPTVLEQ